MLLNSSVGIDLLPSITQPKTHEASNAMSEAECDLKTSEGKFDPIIIQYSLSIFIFWHKSLDVHVHNKQLKI